MRWGVGKEIAKEGQKKKFQTYRRRSKNKVGRREKDYEELEREGRMQRRGNGILPQVSSWSLLIIIIIIIKIITETLLNFGLF